MTLPTCILGRTGQSVTRLGFGAMELAQYGDATEEAAADRLLNAVLDAGITFIDTAPDYGASEELIGQSISARRGEFFLASKCGCLVDREPSLRDGKLEHDFSPKNVRAGVEQSLVRMKTDYLDLVQVHSSPAREVIEAEATVEAMLRLKEEGKIRFLGMSSTLPELEGHLEMGVFDAFQIPYSALQPEHGPLIAQAAATGAGTIIRGGVARGATAVDYDEGAKHGYWREFVAARRDLWTRAGLDALLAQAARDGEAQISPMEFMLRYVLGHPDLHTTIIGTSKIAHLKSNVQAASKPPLSPELIAEVDRLVAEVHGASPA